MSIIQDARSELHNTFLNIIQGNCRLLSHLSSIMDSKVTHVHCIPFATWVVYGWWIISATEMYVSIYHGDHFLTDRH
jgi:hypothetical protein